MSLSCEGSGTQGGLEEIRDPLGGDAARRQHAGDDLRQAVILGERRGEAPILQPLAPEPAADRPLDAQHRGHGKSP
jgi:hypothetical protein